MKAFHEANIATGPEVLPVAAVLPEGSTPPDLEFLRANERQYTALLMQPSGPIRTTSQRIGPADSELAAAKGRRFLELACERHAHLAITPEYFFPWSALKEVIVDDVIPPPDALWVIGCESIAQNGVEEFRQAVAGRCQVLHEPWDSLRPDRTLLDPVVLLFRAGKQDGSTALVALIQFKTYPSRDDMFFEEALLRTGRRIYKFTGTSGHLSAAVIVCSDAFAIEPVLAKINDRSTLIHIQLNPKPTHVDYRRYRATTFSMDPDATNCHIVCLNWAHQIVELDESGQSKEWKNISASTWYCPKGRCSSVDHLVKWNHDRGLYYTYMKELRHALRFHYEEAVFELHVPKLLTVGPGVMANRNGPKMVDRYTWNTEIRAWTSQGVPPEDGLDRYMTKYPAAGQALHHVLATKDRLAVERVLALSAGDVAPVDDWTKLENIDSCTIGADEVMRRISVVQDEQGNEFRHKRVYVIEAIDHALKKHPVWPKQVANLGADATILWSREQPNFNVRAADGKPALVVYLDENHTREKVEAKAEKLYELLRRAGGVHQTRLCIIRRVHEELEFVPLPMLTRFDQTELEMTDIATVRFEEPHYG